MRSQLKTRRKAQASGFTLLEVLVALVVLAIGGFSTLELVNILTRSNAYMGGQTDAVALATKLLSEIEGAKFIDTTTYDPGLEPDTVVKSAVDGSTIRTVGDFAPGGQTGQPIFHVYYQVAGCGTASKGGLSCAPADCPSCLSWNGVEVLVEVTNINEGGPLLKPVEMVLRKEYSPSMAASGTPVRGWQ